MSPWGYVLLGGLSTLGLQAIAVVALGFAVGMRAVRASRSAAIERIRAAARATTPQAAQPPSPDRDPGAVVRH